MNGLLKAVVLTVVLATVAVPVFAGIDVFQLHDHPDGALIPPMYGLRLDDIVGAGQFLFSFDYADMSGMADVTLAYDDVLMTIHISGFAYGGKKVGSGWDPVLKGWIFIDFVYTVGVSEQDDCPGAVGDDLYVTMASASNTGSISLIGWGGDAVLVFSDKANESGCTFSFDNDTDFYGNAGLEGDLSLYSCTGWLMPEAIGGFRDWVCYGERLTVGTEETTWGSIKAQYR